MKIEALQRLHASASKNAWPTKDTYGPPAMTVKEAKAHGFTEGPYYHGTKERRNFLSILRKGFRSKGAKGWQLDSPGEVEEFERWGTVDPVMFTPDREAAAGFGDNVVTCYVKKGRIHSAVGKTIFGGLYVTNPADIVPIKDMP